MSSAFTDGMLELRDRKREIVASSASRKRRLATMRATLFLLLSSVGFLVGIGREGLASLDFFALGATIVTAGFAIGIVSNGYINRWQVEQNTAIDLEAIDSAERLSDILPTIKLPHVPPARVPYAAVASGVLALAVAGVMLPTLLFSSSLIPLTSPIFIAYASLSGLGVLSLTMGITALEERQFSLRQLRVRIAHLQDRRFAKEEGEPLRAKRHLRERRDHLLVSGEPEDAAAISQILARVESRKTGRSISMRSSP